MGSVLLSKPAVQIQVLSVGLSTWPRALQTMFETQDSAPVRGSMLLSKPSTNTGIASWVKNLTKSIADCGRKAGDTVQRINLEPDPALTSIRRDVKNLAKKVAYNVANADQSAANDA